MLKNKKNKRKQLNSYIKYSSLTAQMAVIIITGTFFGDYLDNSNNSEIPFYTIIFSIFSIFLSLYYVLRKIAKDNDKK